MAIERMRFQILVKCLSNFWLMLQPRACVDHADIYHAVYPMLEELLLDTDGDWRVVEFIGSFHTAVRKAEAMCGKLVILGPVLHCVV